MRLGRILLALLAPLVSFTPALRAELAAAGNSASPSSLAGLWGATVPLAEALTAETGNSSAGHASNLPAAAFNTGNSLLQTKAIWFAASAAALRFFARRHHRALLRC
jgi:hypothetical protein